MAKWLEDFQEKANKVCEDGDLVLTADIWKPTKNIDKSRTEKISNLVSVVHSTSFPFLDIKMTWNRHNKIEFKFYNKPNQLIKYVNDGSCHTKHCLKTIRKRG